MTRARCAFSIITIVFAFSCILYGQEVTATVTGVVTDSSGGVVTGATVTAKNVDTNFSSSTRTSGSGDYVITLLPPGNYKLTVSQSGFKTFEQTGIRLEINQRAKIDVPLSVGQVSETVSVVDEAAIIRTEDSEVGKVIDNKSITQLPLNGRVNIMGLMALAPGIQNAGAQDQVPYFGITPRYREDRRRARSG